MTPSRETPADEPLSFEAALAQLEAIIQALEDGQTPLAESLARYERGIQLLGQCYQALEHAERRIELLSRIDPQGRAHREVFDDSALSLEEKGQARSRRRSRPESTPEQDPGEMDDGRRLF